MTPNDTADGCLIGEPSPDGLDLLKVGPGGDFLVTESGARFTPWGMRAPSANVEAFWHDDWNQLVATFREVRRMGFNIVRFNLQFSTFVGPPSSGHPDGTPNQASLCAWRTRRNSPRRWACTSSLSGLRLETDSDNGDWYATRPAAERWRSQAVYWTAIASRLEHSDAVAWYDVMNEPSASIEGHPTWCAASRRGFCYIQFLDKERSERTSVDLVREWMAIMRDAVREGDTRHLVTTSALPWGNGGFRPKDLDGLQDIASVHLYPFPGKEQLDATVADAQAHKPAGRPLILDETGPIGGGNVASFIIATAPIAAGWVGQYFDETPAEIVGNPDATTGDLWHLGSYHTFMRLGGDDQPERRWDRPALAVVITTTPSHVAGGRTGGRGRPTRSRASAPRRRPARSSSTRRARGR